MPNFGPLASTECPDLQALSTSQALTAIRREIHSSVLQIAPPKPLTRPPHKRGHYETGPHLWFEPDRCFNLGRWYQICKTCGDPDVIRFNTKPLKRRLITGKSALGRLIKIYEEILSFPVDEDEVSIASSDGDDDNDSDHNDNNDHDHNDSGKNGYEAAPTPATTHGIKRQHSGPSKAATRIVKRRYFSSPQAETAATTSAPSTLPLALRRGRRPAPFPILSPLYETFEL